MTKEKEQIESDMTIFEVEIKFKVEDTAELEHQLRQFGCPSFGGRVRESDIFFRHPSRDFVQTDECLRYRRRTDSEGHTEYSLTYKGPKVDTETKTRKEIEMPLAEPETMTAILSALGFRKAAAVRKIRRRTGLTVEKRHIEIVLDELPDLPADHRLYVELETLAEEKDVEAGRQLLMTIASQLGLSNPIRDSYLKLVQEAKLAHEVKGKK